MKAEKCIPIFIQAIHDYHVKDDINSTLTIPSELSDFEALLYEKCWIDTVQWHMEDLIRNPSIDPVEGMTLKRRIDQSNQVRTDTVEKIDDFFWMKFKDNGDNTSTWNTESPGWVLDKLSILCLKIYHMKEQTLRTDIDEIHIETCTGKLQVLVQQQEDLTISYNDLIIDYENGVKVMKLYRQMKMYNDKTLNPVLYKKSSSN
tara:strand:- start:688 stop:1296 length:609 start_codon:yes stop_codon:yes gene_type:complete